MKAVARGLARTIAFACVTVCAMAGCGSTASASVYFSQVINVYYGTVTVGSSSTNIVEIEGSDEVAAGLVPNASVAESLGSSLAAQFVSEPLSYFCIFPVCPPGGTPIPQFVLTAISNAPSPYTLGLNGSLAPPDPAITAFDTALTKLGLPGNATFSPVDDDNYAFTIQVNDAADQITMLGNFEFYQLSETPLPATWSLMLIGLAGLAFVAYRRRKPDSALA
jgi:hypothetical protein